MNKSHVLVAFTALMLVAAAAMIVAAAQTKRPGEPTQAKVWIQNTGTDEAVPVTIEELRTKMPWPVTVAGLPPITIAPGNIGPVRAARQEWEYRSMSVGAGQDAVALLSGPGREGWETTGVQFTSKDGAVVVLLKRPR